MMSMFRPTYIALAAGLVVVTLVAAPDTPAAAYGGNCSVTHIGEVPLSDTGDLYATGNVMPAAHAGAAPLVTPVDGVIGVVSLGMSNGQQEWGRFMLDAAGRNDLGPALRFANGAQGGVTMSMWANPNDNAWDFAEAAAAEAGIRSDQVRVLWLKMGSQLSDLGNGSLEQRVALERGWLNDILDRAGTVFPNVVQVYLSSRIYGGYELSSNHAEPQTGYDNGFAVQAVVADAVAGATSVWAAWGPYLWADGTSPRSDGLTWQCDDFASDGVHPSASGEAKVAGMLMDFFASEPVACQWFLADPGTCGTPGLGATTFRDVPTTSIFYADIEWLATEGITTGCNPPLNDLFCPTDLVTRGQMAAFLDRALGLRDGPNAFADDDDSVFEANINALAAAGITTGCNPPVNTAYCPTDFVTRGQMAAFLVRAFGLPPGPERFVDDDGSVFEADIEALAAAGITLGCNPPANTMFCPNDLITRQQMAAFLHRAVPYL
jgi:hypothetical protein